jgi:hypothetical protein
MPSATPQQKQAAGAAFVGFLAGLLLLAVLTVLQIRLVQTNSAAFAAGTVQDRTTNHTITTMPDNKYIRSDGKPVVQEYSVDSQLALDQLQSQSDTCNCLLEVDGRHGVCCSRMYQIKHQNALLVVSESTRDKVRVADVADPRVQLVASPTFDYRTVLVVPDPYVAILQDFDMRLALKNRGCYYNSNNLRNHNAVAAAWDKVDTERLGLPAKKQTMETLCQYLVRIHVDTNTTTNSTTATTTTAATEDQTYIGLRVVMDIALTTWLRPLAQQKQQEDPRALFVCDKDLSTTASNQKTEYDKILTHFFPGGHTESMYVLPKRAIIITQQQEENRKSHDEIVRMAQQLAATVNQWDAEYFNKELEQIRETLGCME